MLVVAVFSSGMKIQPVEGHQIGIEDHRHALGRSLMSENGVNRAGRHA